MRKITEMETRLVFQWWIRKGQGGGGAMTLMGQHEGSLCVDGAMLAS